MDIYKDIETRTKGEIYIGVVGPVRTGKSTFIKHFMEMLVIPAIENEHDKVRAKDELPQSGTGKTIMTTEPKFIPKEAVEISVNGTARLKCRLIDCVGYMVSGAEGHEEDGKERLVKTPWFDYDIPFTKAAETGTGRVINDHSTVGIVVTTDGSVTDLSREAYIEPEARAINELKKLNKPFIVVLNTNKQASPETLNLVEQMEKEYGVTVLPINCEQLKTADLNRIFENLLLGFPISSVNFQIPKWIEAADEDNIIKSYLITKAKELFESINLMKDAQALAPEIDEYIESIDMKTIDMADGTAWIDVKLYDKYYYEMLSEMMGEEINNEYDFIREVKRLAKTKSECDKVSTALMQSIKTGYGSVTPEQSDIHLDPPELIKSGNKFGVKIKAEAPSIHMIKANISTEIAPIVGSEEQARDLIKYIGSDGVSDDGIWEVNIFGKTIKQLVEDGLKAKINKINQESQQKLQDTMEKIVNDSNGGLVCIII